ncbi:hypothetical protein [Persicobacter sp. CCB-QB2]|uniref:hypothetical protein n=1 Tax=Persicobacter sp. CCB-QB2 TaxID=1561025 RepID=UPI0006A9848E|nr:hypothetical protein [Persicobacter sp. CCB-QB2]
MKANWYVILLFIPFLISCGEGEDDLSYDNPNDIPVICDLTKITLEYNYNENLFQSQTIFDYKQGRVVAMYEQYQDNAVELSMLYDYLPSGQLGRLYDQSNEILYSYDPSGRLTRMESLYLGSSLRKSFGGKIKRNFMNRKAKAASNSLITWADELIYPVAKMYPSQWVEYIYDFDGQLVDEMTYDLHYENGNMVSAISKVTLVDEYGFTFEENVEVIFEYDQQPSFVASLPLAQVWHENFWSRNNPTKLIYKIGNQVLQETLITYVYGENGLPVSSLDKSTYWDGNGGEEYVEVDEYEMEYNCP